MPSQLIGVVFIFASPFLSLDWMTPVAIGSLAIATLIFAGIPVIYKRTAAESAAAGDRGGDGGKLSHRGSSCRPLLCQPVVKTSGQDKAAQGAECTAASSSPQLPDDTLATRAAS